MKTILQFAAALCLLAVGYSAVWLAHSAAGLRADLAATENRATASLQAVTATLEATREDLAVTQAALVTVSTKLADSTSNSLHLYGNKVVSSVDHVEKTASGAVADLAKVREDLRPLILQSVGTLSTIADALQQVRTATVNATAMLDDMYPDLKALVESTTVTVTSAAQVSQDVRAVSPAVTKDAAQTVKNVRRATSWPMVLGRALISGICKLKFW